MLCRVLHFVLKSCKYLPEHTLHPEMTMQHHEKVLQGKTHPSLTFIRLHGRTCLLHDTQNGSAVQSRRGQFVTAQRGRDGLCRSPAQGLGHR